MGEKDDGWMMVTMAPSHDDDDDDGDDWWWCRWSLWRRTGDPAQFTLMSLSEGQKRTDCQRLVSPSNHHHRHWCGVVLLSGVHREAAVHWTQRLPRRGWSDHQPRRHNQNSRLGYFVRLCGFHFYNADLHTRNIMTHSASVALNSGQLTQGIKLTQ